MERESDRTISARVGRDCRRQLRVRYALPDPVSEELPARAGGSDVVIRRFSRQVEGARDFFRFRAGLVTVAGSVGGRTLDVVFEKPDGGSVWLVVRAFEGRLERWGCGRVAR